ncbi:hypothetical protein [Hominifimenecus sp. rT4P-3]|uniref:hypothetical protein n=1 Tax=Hominifimenecus sp. rT4P-3 TaxID=3242979 RepID=UPI003DA66824
MKKAITAILLAGALCMQAEPAFAETIYGSSDWKVTFTKESKMESSFDTNDLDQAVYSMQPGDMAVITLSLENVNETATDWYMTNKVLSSLEDGSSGNGGAYTYTLTYHDKDGNATVLFSSDTVGGDTDTSGVGLHGASGALEDYFYLDTLATGQKGSITLEVGLDGETQGNDYQNTLADLQMNFAVELNESGTTPGSGKVIKTGDDTNLAPFIVMAAVSGTLLLLLSIYGRKVRGDEEEEAQ